MLVTEVLAVVVVGPVANASLFRQDLSQLFGDEFITHIDRICMVVS